MFYTLCSAQKVNKFDGDIYKYQRMILSIDCTSKYRYREGGGHILIFTYTRRRGEEELGVFPYYRLFVYS
jgi:hypothetical protein